MFTKTASRALAAATIAAVVSAKGSEDNETMTFYGYNVSQLCVETVSSLLFSSNLSTCLQVPSLVPFWFLSPEDSLVPPTTHYLEDLCGSPPCTNETLSEASDQVLEACSSDAKRYHVDLRTVLEHAVKDYPIARQAVCLTDESNNATVVANSTDSANDTDSSPFCVETVFTRLESILDTNISASYIENLFTNASARAELVVEGQPAICSDCVLAWYQALENAEPKLAEKVEPYAQSECGKEWVNGTAQDVGQGAVEGNAMTTE